MENLSIKVENVSKSFRLPHERIDSVKKSFVSIFKFGRTIEMQHALQDVSLEIKKGEFFGIVGRNGSGKSTLLKMLAGIYQPSKGKVQVAGRLVPFIELGVGFNPELTGRENVYLNGALLGFSKKEIDKFYDEVVEFAELEQFMDKKLKNYSSGMQVRLAFSMAVRAQADILLVDEVLAVGDADFQRKCFEYFKLLKKNKKTVVFVSHDMGAVREFCDRAALIESSHLKAVGTPKAIAREYSQLFLQGQDGQVEKQTKRWGNGEAKAFKISAKIDGDHLLVDVTLKANADLEKVVYGLHINSQDGAEVAAMNNRMLLRPDIEGLKDGDTVNLHWKVLNVLNDGKYTITLTFIDQLANTLDWIVDAAGFRVKRPERSTTAVLPPVEVEVEY